MKDKNNKSKFPLKEVVFKLLVISLFAFILVLVGYDFWSQKVSITKEMIIVICIALVISLSEGFNTFQIGKLVRIEKEKETIDNENKSLKEQLKIMANIVNNVSNNVNVNNAVSIEIPSIKDKNENQNSEEITNKTSRHDDVIEKYIKKNSDYYSTIVKEPHIKIDNVFGKGTQLFDLYIKNDLLEQFVECKKLVPSMENFAFVHKQLYYVESYNRENFANAQYVLLLNKEAMDGNNSIAQINRKKYEKLLEIFKDKIEKGIMKVEII